MISFPLFDPVVFNPFLFYDILSSFCSCFSFFFSLLFFPILQYPFLFFSCFFIASIRSYILPFSLSFSFFLKKSFWSLLKTLL
ncbi:hypothetical protein BC829DRAFT_401755, partial [Chytridium lagenaria]